MRDPSLLVLVDYLELLVEVKPEKLEPAAVRWHGRLEVEASSMTLAESQLALAVLASLCAGERDAVETCGGSCGGCGRRWSSVLAGSVPAAGLVVWRLEVGCWCA